MEEEMILVVRRALFDSLGAFQGFSAHVDRYLPSLLDRENNFFVARSSAETDPGLKQIIPYALIVANGQILRYRRGKSSGEQRLVAKYSIGIGGHMNDRMKACSPWITRHTWPESNARSMKKSRSPHRDRIGSWV